MTSSPLDFACPHTATAQERMRDPVYMACNAGPGAPCRWSRRYDGETDPAFHAARLEAAAQSAPAGLTPDVAALREAILDTGLV